MNVTDLHAMVFNEANRTRVRRLLGEARERGLRPVMTFFTLGGGTTGDRSTTILTEARVRVEAKALVVAWAPDHVFHGRLGIPGYWDCLNIHHPTAEYDLDYLCHIAEACADLLCAVLSELRGEQEAGLDLADVIEGIEIFNEVDICSVRITSEGPQVEVNARHWARAYYRVAAAFHERFRHNGFQPPRFLVPGVASYDDLEPGSDTQNTLRYKLSFVSYFLGYVAGFAAAEGRVSTRAILGGMDYHWYHTRRGRVRHIGSLVGEYAVLRRLLDAWDADDALLTCFESGTNGEKRTDEDGADDGEDINYKPAGIDYSEFQAQEVWRRLCGAVVAGFDIVGWHSRMSTPAGSVFTRYGLRKDDETLSAASQAVQRASWFAYQRVASLIDRAVSAAMVLPLAEPFLTDVHRVPDDPEDDVVVFEFRAEGMWVYVLFVDPWRDETRAFCLEFRFADGSNGEMEELAALPSRTEEVESGDTTNLPFRVAEYPTAVITDVPGLTRVQLGQPPRVYATARRVSWEVVSCPAPLAFPLSEHSAAAVDGSLTVRSHVREKRS